MRARWPALRPGVPSFPIGELYDPRCIKGPYNPHIRASWGPGGATELMFDGRDTGSGHSCDIIGSGGGKTQRLILALRRYWTSSAIILDPKQNLAQQLRRDRELMGHTVHVLGGDCGFNAIGWIAPDTLDTGPHIDRTVEWVCGETPEHMGGDNTRFFTGAAKDIVRGVLSHMFSDKSLDDDLRTYRTMRSVISRPEEEFRDYITAIYNMTDSRRARELLAFICSKDNDTVRSIQYTAQRLTAWLSTEKWENMVCGRSFEAADITNGRTDVVLPISFQDLSAEPAVARCILGALFNAGFGANGEGGHPMLFALDEIAELKDFGPIRTTLRQGREFNMFLHLMYQSYADVIKQWGQNGMIELLENCTWISWAGIKDFTVAEDISKRIGEYPVVAVSESTNTGISSRLIQAATRSRGRTVTISEMGRRRIKPEEIIGLREDAQLISARGIPPMICGLPADHKRRAAERMAA